MAHHESRGFQTDPANLVTAVKQSIATLGWRIKSEDPVRWAIHASTRMGWVSWGENVALHITSGPDGGAVLTADVRLKFGFFGWGIEGRRAVALFNEVQRRIGSPLPPPPSR